MREDTASYWVAAVELGALVPERVASHVPTDHLPIRDGQEHLTRGSGSRVRSRGSHFRRQAHGPAGRRGARRVAWIGVPNAYLLITIVGSPHERKQCLGVNDDSVDETTAAFSRSPCRADPRIMTLP